MNQSNIDVVLFDKDGTLLDMNKTWVPYIRALIQDLSEAYGIDQINKLLFELGIHEQDIDLNGVSMSGSTSDVIRVLNRYAKTDVAHWFNTYNTDHKEDLYHSMTVVDDAKNVLNKMKNAGFVLGLVTNDQQYSTQMFVDKFNLSKYFDYIICSDEKGSNKPDKQFIEPITSLYHSDRIIIVGDSMKDIELAQNSNVRSIIIGDNVHLQEAADYYVDRIGQIMELSIFTE